MSITNCQDATAISVLSKYTWNLESALGAYFENPALQDKAPAKKFDRAKLEKFFNAYRGLKFAVVQLSYQTCFFSAFHYWRQQTLFRVNQCSRCPLNSACRWTRCYSNRWHDEILRGLGCRPLRSCDAGKKLCAFLVWWLGVCLYGYVCMCVCVCVFVISCQHLCL